VAREKATRRALHRRGGDQEKEKKKKKKKKQPPQKKRGGSDRIRGKQEGYGGGKERPVALTFLGGRTVRILPYAYLEEKNNSLSHWGER